MILWQRQRRGVSLHVSHEYGLALSSLGSSGTPTRVSGAPLTVAVTQPSQAISAPTSSSAPVVSGADDHLPFAVGHEHDDLTGIVQ